MIGIDTTNMQDMMTANSSSAQQSVIQGTAAMNVNHQSSSSTNPLLYTATGFTQDMSSVSQNNQQQMMAMHQNRQQQQQQQQNESSSQAMMSDLNPFISDGMMNQQSHQQSDQMMTSNETSADKEAYKRSRGYLRTQLP